MGIKAQHLVNVSGGKDSTAVYLLAIESGRPFRAVFADTGIHDIVEWSRTGRGGRQFDLFFQYQAGGGCTSDLGLCET